MERAPLGAALSAHRRFSGPLPPHPAGPGSSTWTPLDSYEVGLFRVSRVQGQGFWVVGSPLYIPPAALPPVLAAAACPLP